MENIITVKAPATTANLGPSFDCLGLALQLYCTVSLEITDGETTCTCNGEGAETVTHDANNLVLRVIHGLCSAQRIPIPKLRISTNNEIPIARGLGSSAAVIAATLMAGNLLLCDGDLTVHELLDSALEFEPHPDNLAAALFGGLVMSACVDGKAYAYPFTRSRNVFLNKTIIVAIPDFAVSTGTSRKELFVQPVTQSHEGYARGMAKAIANIIAFANGNVAALATTMHDTVWHEEQRKKYIPFMDDVTKAALNAGGYGVALSGSGPTMICITNDAHADAVSAAMSTAIEKYGITSVCKKLKPDYDGTQITVISRK